MRIIFRKLDQSDFTLADAVDDSLLFDDPWVKESFFDFFPAAPPDDEDNCRLTDFCPSVVAFPVELVFVFGRVSFSELELSDDELDDRCVIRFVSLSDDDDELVLSDRLNTINRQREMSFEIT
jgi:hypothetical protein